MPPIHSTAQQHTLQQHALEKEQLKTILEQENTCLSQIVHLLKIEHKAIIDRDTPTMGALLDKKSPLLSKLEQLDKQRQDFYEKTNRLAYTNKNFTRYIEQQSSELISICWKQIKQQLSLCKKQNELNGRMINIRKNNTEQILQILLGHPINNTQTYSHLGQTHLQKRSALYTAV